MHFCGVGRARSVWTRAGNHGQFQGGESSGAHRLHAVPRRTARRHPSRLPRTLSCATSRHAPPPRPATAQASAREDAMAPEPSHTKAVVKICDMPADMLECAPASANAKAWISLPRRDPRTLQPPLTCAASRDQLRCTRPRRLSGSSTPRRRSRSRCATRSCRSTLACGTAWSGATSART